MTSAAAAAELSAASPWPQIASRLVDARSRVEADGSCPAVLAPISQAAASMAFLAQLSEEKSFQDDPSLRGISFALRSCGADLCASIERFLALPLPARQARGSDGKAPTEILREQAAYAQAHADALLAQAADAGVHELRVNRARAELAAAESLASDPAPSGDASLFEGPRAKAAASVAAGVAEPLPGLSDSDLVAAGMRALGEQAATHLPVPVAQPDGQAQANGAADGAKEPKAGQEAPKEGQGGGIGAFVLCLIIALPLFFLLFGGEEKKPAERPSPAPIESSAPSEASKPLPPSLPQQAQQPPIDLGDAKPQEAATAQPEEKEPPRRAPGRPGSMGDLLQSSTSGILDIFKILSMIAGLGLTASGLLRIFRSMQDDEPGEGGFGQILFGGAIMLMPIILGSLLSTLGG